MKSSTMIVIAIIVIICLGFIIIPKWDKGSETPEENSAITPESNKLEVLAVIAQSKKLNNDLRITGSLTANESVELKSEVSGVVRSILFKEGDRNLFFRYKNSNFLFITEISYSSIDSPDKLSSKTRPK